MHPRPVAPALAALAAAGLLTACMRIAPASRGGDAAPALVAAVEGLSGPESVRYDPAQDVYFVGNFNGPGNALDDNGFVSRVRPDGTIAQLRFIAGGAAGATLHAPRGMTITGDTLWIADVDAVRGFHRVSGAPLATVSFTGMDVGFLNDLTPGPDGALYLTDTGRNRIYRIADGRATVVHADTTNVGPNGITWDRVSADLLVASWNHRNLYAWTPGSALRVVGESATGRRFDGIEVLADGSVLAASQADSSLHLFRAFHGTPIVKLAGAPADIAVDTKRNRVAVPYIARNRVEIWQLP